MKKKFIIIAGYHGSGSSAVTDLLKEYEGIYECDAEVRYFTDPYGIIQLEQALTDNWDWIRSTAAIFDFLEYTKKCVRKKTHFPLAPFGMGYADTINKDFYRITEKYIEELTEGRFREDFYTFKAKKSFLQYVVDRCRFGIELYSQGKIKCANYKLCYFSHPSKEQFSKATKRYNDELFNDFFAVKNVKYVLLDQAIMPNDAEVINRYFSNAKMIIVDRDPRDMYINFIKYAAASYIGKSVKDGEIYAKQQLALRSKTVTGDNILRVRFEDLIFDYEETKKIVTDFLNVPEKTHLYEYKYLKPEISMKNIGHWKAYYKEYKDAIDKIAEMMPMYLYES